MSGNGITALEKVDCRRHMGYLNVSEAQTFVLGTPAATETQFLIEGAMTRILVEAMPRFREYLGELNSIEREKSAARKRMKAKRIGNLETNPEEQRDLDAQYLVWQGKLADLLGCPPNPFSKAFEGGGAFVNVPVMH